MVRATFSAIFEAASILATILLVYLFKSESRVMILFYVSLAQAATLEYLFYRRGKYRYSKLFRLVVPRLDLPPLSIVIGYFWFYFIAFYTSTRVVSMLTVASPPLVALIFLLFSFIVEFVVELVLGSGGIGLWTYTTRSRRIAGVPLGVLSTVPCLMALALYIAYYSNLLLGDLGFSFKVMLLMVIGVLGGLGIGLVKRGLPGPDYAQAVLLPSLFIIAVSLASHLAGL